MLVWLSSGLVCAAHATIQGVGSGIRGVYLLVISFHPAAIGLLEIIFHLGGFYEL